MKTLTTIISALIAVSATAFSAPSQATLVYKTTMNHGSVACVGMTRTYQNMLATRAEGRRNTTTTTAVVQCGGVSTPLNNDGDVVVYEVGLNNATAADIDVSCSLVDGFGAAGGTVSVVYPRSVTIPAGGAAYIDWNGVDTGGTSWDNGPHFIYPSMTCQLPLEAEIGYTAIIYQEDNGL
jgi:hypothetical protein